MTVVVGLDADVELVDGGSVVDVVLVVDVVVLLVVVVSGGFDDVVAGGWVVDVVVDVVVVVGAAVLSSVALPIATPAPAPASNNTNAIPQTPAGLMPSPLSALRTPRRRHSLTYSRLKAPSTALVSLPLGPRSARA